MTNVDIEVFEFS